MVNILTSDLLISDIIARTDDCPKLKDLVQKYGYQDGDKNALSAEQFKEFASATDNCPLRTTPGGSSFNTVTTLAKLLDDVNVDFIGMTGQGHLSSGIHNALAEARVKLHPQQLPEGKVPVSAASYVVVFPDGGRTIATYPGNAKELVNKEMITDELVKKSDVVLVQGSLWQKMDKEVADRLLELRWQQNKELWLALPTQAKFGKEKADDFRYLLTSSNVILSNDSELSTVLKIDFHKGDTKALYALQKLMQENDPLKAEGKYQRRPQVAFVTRGRDGCAVVTRDDIKFIPRFPLRDEEIVNTLGAG